MELREQFPTRADVQQLEHVSFSREQIAGLLQSHSTLSAGVYHEDEPSHKDRGFTR